MDGRHMNTWQVLKTTYSKPGAFGVKGPHTSKCCFNAFSKFNWKLNTQYFLSFFLSFFLFDFLFLFHYYYHYSVFTHWPMLGKLKATCEIPLFVNPCNCDQQNWKKSSLSPSRVRQCTAWVIMTGPVSGSVGLKHLKIQPCSIQIHKASCELEKWYVSYKKL